MSQVVVPSTQVTGPVGRLAPSPTGLLHLGHARSFLLAWWSVRSRGGRLVLRVEDLDGARSRPEMVDACLADLEWLGLDWDGAPRLSSADTGALERAAATLEAAGAAYPCVCTRAEIAAASAPHLGELETRYPGTCRGRWATLAQARAESGREAALRLRVPEGPVEIHDRLHGDLSFDVQAAVGDFLLRRRDLVWGYQFAVVVDDLSDGVDEVLRGDDLLPSTARQALVLAALGRARPTWVHVPLVLDAQGERLAKRRGGHTLCELRAAGVDARAVVAWAARSAGLRVEPRASAAEALAAFDLARLPREAHRLTAGELATIERAR